MMTMDTVQYRWNILHALFKEQGVSPHTLHNDELAGKLDVSWDKLRDSVDYLAQNAYLTVRPASRGTLFYDVLHLTPKGIDLIEHMRGHTSGMCIPTFVVDGVSGKGKIPLSPNYLLSCSPGGLVLRNYNNQVFTYHHPAE